jgi:hypothetical protein
MAELWPSRETARPRNVPDWMVDRLDDYTALSSGAAPNASDDLTELRRQQEAFHRVRSDLDVQNSWLALPVLAAEAGLLGVGVGGSGVAAMAAPAARQATHLLTEKDLYPKVGDFWATRIGRRAHKALAERVRQKPDWDAERNIPAASGGKVRPDVLGPIRPKPGRPKARYLMDLKPNTLSGRRAAARTAKRYKAETDHKTRGIFYDPKDFR